MTTASPYAASLVTVLVMAICIWLLATVKRNAGLVDIFWPLFFLATCLVHAVQQPELAWRSYAVLGLTAVWAARLSLYLTLRNWGTSEDHRYRDIRARNEPGFVWKSLYLVFALQAALAWLIATPLTVSIHSVQPLGWLDAVGTVVVVGGIFVQAAADAQLTRFKADPLNAQRVMHKGLWRFSRHPNYFAECCIWWGFYLVAFAAGGWWTLFSPLIMTFLLLRVSGVALLERDIAERRPAYRDYIRTTSAFIPWPPRIDRGDAPRDVVDPEHPSSALRPK